MSLLDEFLSQFSLPPPEDTPTEVVQSYDFVSCISQKLTREVYLLRHKQGGSKAILKMAAREDPEDLQRAYRILSDLEHPGIPKVLGYWQQGQKRFLLREWAEGETLDALVMRDGVFSERRVLEITRSLCGILSYLHTRKPPVVFRDIKPQNITLTQNGKLSLIDFGIVKEVSDQREMQTALIGTQAFAAPEHYGFSKTGPETDIYSIGNLMLWLATGSTGEKARQELQGGNLARIVDKCTELSPRLRFRSVDALARRIDHILHPPKAWEISLTFGVGALVLVVGTLWWNGALPDVDMSAPVTEPVIVGRGYEKEAAFPVSVQVLRAGKAYTDCVVSIDNRHWYYPAEDGFALLKAYAYDFYTLRVASENQQAVVPISVNRASSLSLSVDLDQLPVCEPYISLQMQAGEEHDFPLAVQNIDELQLQGEPQGVFLSYAENGIGLKVSSPLGPGFYSFFVEAKNSVGIATGVVALHVQSEQPLQTITSSEQLDLLRLNPNGNYRLAADLDLSQLTDFHPIGNIENPFTGSIDGDGYRIYGLNLRSSDSLLGFLGCAKGAVLKNLVFEQPMIEAEGESYSNIGVVVGMAEQCLIENCAVFGGKITARVGRESNIGGICGYGSGHITGCFSSADLENYPEGREAQSYLGGVCGVLLGYLTECGSAGRIEGSFVAGGIVGMNDNSVMTSSFSAGQVQGGFIYGQLPAGGIAHIMRVGRAISDCVFRQDSAEVGVSVTTNGYPLRLHAVEEELFLRPTELSALLKRSEPLRYASLDSAYPLPGRIFAEQLPEPRIENEYGVLMIEPQPETSYFYTLDGSDPYRYGRVAEALELRLTEGEELQVFAARKGRYDSEVIRQR